MICLNRQAIREPLTLFGVQVLQYSVVCFSYRTLAQATIAAVGSPLIVTYDVEARKAITDLLAQIKNYKGSIPAGLPNTQAAK